MGGNIKAKILTPAIKEINEKTDINLIVEEIKVGKKVGVLKFKTSNKENQTKSNSYQKQKLII